MTGVIGTMCAAENCLGKLTDFVAVVLAAGLLSVPTLALAAYILTLVG